MSSIMANAVLRTGGMAVVASLALALSACGGGGGGGFVESTPPPPPGPPAAFAMSAPARATTPPGVPPVLANATGPNFANGPASGTQFPLLQTAVIYDRDSVSADANVNAAGGTVVVESGALRIEVAAFQNASQDLQNSWIGDQSLEWSRYGYWQTGGGAWDYDDTVGRHAVFVTGYETPGTAIPTTGTATYSAGVEGVLFYPGIDSGSTKCGCIIARLMGEATFTANFGTRNVSGALTGIYAGPFWDPFEGDPWNDVAFTSTMTGNGFSGTTSVTTNPHLASSLSSAATGTIEGKFFGPAAEEAGAVWTLFDGTKAAVGTLSGKHP